MQLRYPVPLRPGDVVAVTAPSSGVPPALHRRLDAAITSLRERGFEVLEGVCLRDGATSEHVSASAPARADELMALLVDPDVAAVVPPWGGETGIDLLPYLDLELLSASEPCWYVGFSDVTTTMLPLTTVAGWATLEGWNLMDTPYRPARGLLHWLDVATHGSEADGPGQGSPFVQTQASHRRAQGWDDYENDPAVSEMTLTEPTRWRVLGGGDARFAGRLIGGCLEVVSPLAGTPYGDVPAWARRVRELTGEGVIVHLEVAEANPYEAARTLHGLRLSGWFDDAVGVLVGRTPALGVDGWSQHDAVADALGSMGLPVVLDVDLGHQQPMMSLVNGARGEVVVDGEEARLTQSMTPLGGPGSG